MDYDFPGNIRELENIIEHAFVLSRGTEIATAHLPRDLLQKFLRHHEKESLGMRKLDHAEAQVIRNVLTKHRGHRNKAAKELGIHVVTLWRKMKKLGIKD